MNFKTRKSVYIVEISTVQLVHDASLQDQYKLCAGCKKYSSSIVLGIIAQYNDLKYEIYMFLICVFHLEAFTLYKTIISYPFPQVTFGFCAAIYCNLLSIKFDFTHLFFLCS